MTEEDLQVQRVAGEIWLTLENGTHDEKERLLQFIERVIGPIKREAVEQKLNEQRE